MATQFADVESLIGVASRDAGTPLGVTHTVARGVSLSAVDRVARAVAPTDPKFKFRLVARSTLARRRGSRQRLSIEESDRVARVAKVFEMALSVFKDEDRARQFLVRPHAMLEQEAPLNLTLASGTGADAVVQLLGRAAYGGGA